MRAARTFLLVTTIALGAACSGDEGAGPDATESDASALDASAPDAAGPDATVDPGFEILVRGPENAHDVVSDADNLYWVAVDQSINRSSIRRIAKTGGADEELWLVGKRIYNITLNDTYVYAAVYGVNPVGLGDVARVPKAGGPPEILVAGVANTDGIVVDDAFVYYSFFDGDSQAISRAPKAGGSPELLVSDVQGGAQLAVDDTFLFYTEGNSGRVMRIPKAGGAPVELASGWIGTGFILADDTYIYFTACPGPSCMPRLTFRMTKDGSDLTQLASLPGTGDIALGTDVLVQANPQHGRVYAVPLSGGDTSVLVQGLPAPMATAVDADGAQAYWVDWESGDVGRVGVTLAQ